MSARAALLTPTSRLPKPNHAASSEAVRAYRIESKWGDWRVAFSDAGLRELTLPGHPLKTRATKDLPELAGREGELGRRVRKALEARLRGERTDLPWEAFDLGGRPPFHAKAWRALYEIPFGEVRTYGEIAKAARSPKAVRAAGQACGANPIVLFIPCHRVVASTGPGGFGAGLEWKAKLLELEGYRL
ncbi:MAG: MGMT family protein [Planctomycetes bacterium]|nr:MGMT family protein [Planctomycetota bacterium]